METLCNINNVRTAYIQGRETERERESNISWALTSMSVCHQHSRDTRADNVPHSTGSEQVHKVSLNTANTRSGACTTLKTV